MDDYVSKPIRPDDLFSTIERVIKQIGASAAKVEAYVRETATPRLLS